MPRFLTVFLLLVLALHFQPAWVEASSCPYKDHVKPIIATIAGSVDDATSMSVIKHRSYDLGRCRARVQEGRSRSFGLAVISLPNQ